MAETNLDDGAGLYLDILTVRTTIGMRTEVRDAAKAEHLPMAEYVRQALDELVARTRETAQAGPRQTMALAS